MRKITSLLMLLCAFVGAAKADGVATVDAIKDGYIYTLKTSRNAITWNGTDTKCVGAALDASNENHQFVAIKVSGSDDRFYFYNVGANKFMGKSGNQASLTDANEVYWTIKTSGDTTWPLMIDAQDGDHFNFGGQNQITIDSWGGAAHEIDAGNKFQITEIKAAEASLASKINLIIKATSILSEVRGIIADSKLVGAEAYTDVTALQTALSTYENEQSTSNLTALETALNTLKNTGTKATVTLSAGEKFRVQCFDNERGYMVYSTVEGKSHETNVMLGLLESARQGWKDEYPLLSEEGVYADWAIVEVEGQKYIYNVEKKQCLTTNSDADKVTFSDAGTAVTDILAYDGQPTVFEVKFEGSNSRRLSFSPGYRANDGGVRTYSDRNDAGTKFYIEKTGEGVNETMQTEMHDKIYNAVVTKFNAMKDLTPFSILEGSTVTVPSEFTSNSLNAATLNTDIAAAKAVEDNYGAKKTFIATESGQRLQKLLDLKNSYGTFATVQLTMKAEYGTLIMPCPSSTISGLKRKTLANTDIDANGVINLNGLAEGTFDQNVPYLIQAAEDSKFTIIGWDKGSTGTHTDGLLTGTLNETTKVPAGSYILSKHNDRLGFYLVGENADYTAAKNRCYLTLSEAGSRFGALYFDDVETGIENIDGTEGNIQGNGLIYNMAGQRMNGLQKGLNIVNGKIVIK